MNDASVFADWDELFRSELNLVGISAKLKKIGLGKLSSEEWAVDFVETWEVGADRWECGSLSITDRQMRAVLLLMKGSRRVRTYVLDSPKGAISAMLGLE